MFKIIVRTFDSVILSIVVQVDAVAVGGKPARRHVHDWLI